MSAVYRHTEDISRSRDLNLTFQAKRAQDLDDFSNYWGRSQGRIYGGGGGLQGMQGASDAPNVFS